MPIDYKILLMKYICHIGNSEGIDFLTDRWQPEYISGAEWAELKEVSKEADMFTDELINPHQLYK